MRSASSLFITAVLLICSCISFTNATGPLCDDSLSKVMFEEDYNSIEVTTLFISSPYSINVIAGGPFAAWINGTDTAAADLVISSDNATLVFSEELIDVGNSPIDAPAQIPATKSPSTIRTPRPVSSAGKNSSVLAVLLGFIGGIRLLSKKGLLLLIAFVMLLSLISGIESHISGDVQCPSATITVQVPRYKVRYICINDQQCVCGPGYEGEQCQIEGSVTPVNPPVDIMTPVNPPINDVPPVSAPIAAPIADPPIEVPVAAPIEPPVNPPIDECQDGVMNGVETDVDCGGGTCSGCAEGKACLYDEDCDKMRCLQGYCVDTCNNQGLDLDESDVDCGGELCKGCAAGKKCNLDTDCDNGYCVDKKCYPNHCKNGFIDVPFEPFTDCGGPCPNKCDFGQNCFTDSDCKTFWSCQHKCAEYDTNGNCVDRYAQCE